MRSTMMDFPLTVGHIFEHGRSLYADSQVVTSEADGARRIEFGALADRADQLAAGLRRLGVGPGDRVATFGWNSSEHQEAYFAIPGMGAVMHTINIRLSAEQIRYIIGHAEDSVLIADASLAPVLGPVCQRPELDAPCAAALAGDDLAVGVKRPAVREDVPDREREIHHGAEHRANLLRPVLADRPSAARAAPA